MAVPFRRTQDAGHTYLVHVDPGDIVLARAVFPVPPGWTVGLQGYMYQMALESGMITHNEMLYVVKPVDPVTSSVPGTIPPV